MSNELEYRSHRVAAGRLTRRDFLGRAAALGVTATFANSLRRAREWPPSRSRAAR